MPEYKNAFQSLKLKHLLVGLIFLAVWIIRMIAASLLEITKPEAHILFDITRNPGNFIGQASILYQVLTMPLMRFFGNGSLIVRFWPVLAGSILVLLPLLFEDVLGTRPAVLLSALLALDPFINANSIQINGSALTLCTLVLSVAFLRKQKIFSGVLAFFGFLLSGAAIIYGLLLALFMTLVAAIEKKPNSLAQTWRKVWNYCRNHVPAMAVISLIIFGAAFLLGVRFSDFVGNFLFLFQKWGQPYTIANTPQLYPVALFSYLPFGVILLLITPQREKEAFPAFLAGIWMLVLLVCIALNPGHQILDLVWISLPIAFMGTQRVDGIISQIEENPSRIRIFTLIFCALMISLFIIAVMVIYQYNWDLSVINRLLSLISMLIMITISFIFLAYSESVSLAATTARTSLLIILFVIQAGFSWRALGLNGKPAGEILWGGYYEGADVVRQIVDHSDFDVVKTRLTNQVAFLDYSNDAVEWNVGRIYPTVNLPISLGDTAYTVVITTANDALKDKTSQGYVGQKFVADSYPLWIWQPLKNLLDSDYWFWLIFRQGQMVQEFNYIWVNQKVF